MNLMEYMAHAPEGTIYHIGSKAGFLMITTRSEYGRDILYWEEEYYRKVKTNIIKDLAAIRDPALQQPSTSVSEEKAMKARRKELFDRIRNRLEALEHWMPIPKRKVLETYNRLTGGKAVIIEGEEVGDFWFREEYERWMIENGATEVEG